MDTRIGVQRIEDERARQKGAEGYSPTHDHEVNDKNELAWAAVCYAAPGRVYVRKDFAGSVKFTDPWPWSDSSDRRQYDGNVLLKPTREQYIRQLEKAGALIAAEIDRLLALPAIDPRVPESREAVK